MIDLMHGKIEHVDDIKDDDVWEALLNVAQQSILEPLALDAPPKGYYNPGVLGAEMKLLEDLVFNSRSAVYFLLFCNFANQIYMVLLFQLLFGAIQRFLPSGYN